MAKIQCPLLGELVDDGVCFDIHMVIEGLAPERTIPDKILKNKEYKNICLSCSNHRED